MTSAKRIVQLTSRLSLIGILAVAIPSGAQTRPISSALPTPGSASETRTKPNVLVWMIDDLGFGQLGCFGGLIDTPNLDALAQRGLRYTNYHTTPICSASRAAFLTGRNPHTVNMGGHAALALPFPGYTGEVPRAAGTVAENLRGNGYITDALGKWDHMPSGDMSAAGPFTYWPSGQGFDRFYGFLAAETDNFHPQLWSDHSPVELPNDAQYHLTTDLADHAIRFIESRDATAPRRPFFIYWATGASHAPHHAPASYRERYRGKFDMGWDKAREEILRRQLALGVVPPGTKLSPRPPTVPAWDSLSADQKRMYARQMETFAAQLTHADAQFGRILNALRQNGELENTLVIVTSDNGASAEGALGGTYNQHLAYEGHYATLQENLKYYDAWGSDTTYPHYSNGWAVAGDTPYRYYKVTTYEGGTHVPLIISWPEGIAAHGELRKQYHFVADLTPTILEATGTKPLMEVNGAAQMPFDGISMEYSFDHADAPSRKKAQYYEMFGNEAIWANGWKAVNPHYLDTWTPGSDTPFTNNWELYNLAEDPNEDVDLAKRDPQKLKEMITLFGREAKTYHVTPLHNKITGWKALLNRSNDELSIRNGIWAYPGPISRIPVWRAPPIFAHSYTMTASLDLKGGETGPIMSEGGKTGGISLYLLYGQPVLMYRDADFSTWKITGSTSLPAGRVALELRFKNNATDANVAIAANGNMVASGTIPRPIRTTPAQAADSFAIGVDSSTSVSPDYPDGAVFPAGISNVQFNFNH